MEQAARDRDARQIDFLVEQAQENQLPMLK